MNNPMSDIKRGIEQDAYRYYEQLSGQTLQRRADGSFAGQGHNDALDAFRHAYTSGRVTQLSMDQQWVARSYGDDNEIGPKHPNDPREHRMDLWNNEVGRRLGDEASGKDDLAKRCYEAATNGTLITSLNDTRIGQLYPSDPRLQRPQGDPERELMTKEDVAKVNRDVSHALDHPRVPFPKDHPDRDLYDKLRSGLPAQVTDEKVAEAVLATKRAGMHEPSDIGKVALQNDQIFIAGRTPGFHAQVDAGKPAPDMSGTVQQLNSHNRAEAYEQKNQQQQEQQPNQQYGGR
ncbi:DUF6973 domain-containing protein [Lysobacter enzymogenes]|jgi:hypothetical protein|uniref:DUF6973 domain-containing protein n=1 Tax=Lysobacter enzymogenes TaxID=69 RepID=UPI00089A289D|nr:hypothetical protein [Lysobacter enzymogenes]SDW15293.1 hypothetical protein SAMN05421681_101256 [Lysobacter enzymogenes]